MQSVDEIVLVKLDNTQTDNDGVRVEKETARTHVFAVMQSVGYREFYAAAQAGVKTECKAVIYAAEYSGEQIAIVQGMRYSVLKTYRTGDKLELTLTDMAERNVL